ncbi:hypothetical protein B0H16DRAFT_392313 [Mycena metata]|nr:hypothetical protein B0H16DRAFT_392313 [Mycena metata]
MPARSLRGDSNCCPPRGWSRTCRRAVGGRCLDTHAASAMCTQMKTSPPNSTFFPTPPRISPPGTKNAMPPLRRCARNYLSTCARTGYSRLPRTPSLPAPAPTTTTTTQPPPPSRNPSPRGCSPREHGGKRLPIAHPPRCPSCTPRCIALQQRSTPRPRRTRTIALALPQTDSRTHAHVAAHAACAHLAHTDTPLPDVASPPPTTPRPSRTSATPSSVRRMEP